MSHESHSETDRQNDQMDGEDGQHGCRVYVSTVAGNKVTKAVSEDITVEKQPAAIRKPNSAMELPFFSLNTQSCQLSVSKVYLLMELNVHSNLLRLIRGWVSLSYYLLAALSRPDWLCIKAGSCVRHFNVSLIVWAKSQDSVHKPPFCKRKERRSGSNRSPSAYQPSAVPLGHTGSQTQSVHEERNMGLYVHRNHYGLLGTGKLGGGVGGREFLYLTPTRYNGTTRMTLH